MGKEKDVGEMFEKLSSINVNEYTEGKNGLTYLSWTYAWSEFCKVYPTATYEVWKAANGLPYAFDPNTGYMVYTSVTVDGLTRGMWLPVMDSGNNAMKAVPYSFKTKTGKEVHVATATMFDINKTIMRCLTKCLAMFGLGLYIYAGEDLPEDLTQSEEERAKAEQAERAKLMDEVKRLMAEKKVSLESILEIPKFDSLEAFDVGELKGCINWLNNIGGDA